MSVFTKIGKTSTNTLFVDFGQLSSYLGLRSPDISYIKIIISGAYYLFKRKASPRFVVIARIRNLPRSMRNYARIVWRWVYYFNLNVMPWYVVSQGTALFSWWMMTSSNGNIFRVTRSFDVFFDLRLNKRLSQQSWGWWLWRHCNGLRMLCT